MYSLNILFLQCMMLVEMCLWGLQNSSNDGGRGQRQIKSYATGLEGGRSEQKGIRTRGHRQQCGYCWGEEGIRELNGNGKKYNKD